MENKDYVTASEIGEYVFCKRAWWLSAKKLSQENSQMIAGTSAHNKLLEAILKYDSIKNIAIILIVSSLIVGFLLISYWIKYL